MTAPDCGCGAPRFFRREEAPATRSRWLPDLDGLAGEARARARPCSRARGAPSRPPPGAGWPSSSLSCSSRSPERAAPRPLRAPFSAAEWAANAQAWLDAGQPQAALRAAERAGSDRLRDRRTGRAAVAPPAVALAWASARRRALRRVSGGTGRGRPPARVGGGACHCAREGFGEMLRAARRADELLRPPTRCGCAASSSRRRRS